MTGSIGRRSVAFLLVAAVAVMAGSQALESRQRGRAGQPPQGERPPALLQDYTAFSVTPPPDELGLDPFYEKYTDAHGIPVVASDKTPDAALLMARDIVRFMLADRPDLRKELIRQKWKLAIMAETEVTYDIPEHRMFRPLPAIDDERLTPQQRANYYEPGGVGTMTGEEYWNSRVRQRPRARVGARERPASLRAGPAGDPVEPDAGQRLHRADAGTVGRPAVDPACSTAGFHEVPAR